MSPESSYVSVTTIIRPADTTPYAAGDVVGPTDARLPLANIGPAGSGMILTGCDFRALLAAVPAGMTSFRLYVFSGQPSAIADNAAFPVDYLATNEAIYRTYIDLGAPVATSGILHVKTTQINEQLELPAGQTQLWGVLVTNTGFTPVSGGTFKIKLRNLSA